MAGQNVCDLGSGDVELGQQFDFAAGDDRVYAQLFRHRYEVFLQHLHGYRSGSGTAVFGYELEGAVLLCRRGFVVGVDEDVGIEEAAGGHLFFSRRAFSRRSFSCRS
jgi:hypothetical protein